MAGRAAVVVVGQSAGGRGLSPPSSLPARCRAWALAAMIAVVVVLASGCAPAAEGEIAGPVAVAAADGKAAGPRAEDCAAAAEESSAALGLPSTRLGDLADGAPGTVVSACETPRTPPPSWAERTWRLR